MKNNSLTLFLISVFAILIPYSLLMASPPVILEEKKKLYPLGLHLEYLEDQTGKLSIEEVSSSEFDSRFTASHNKVLNFGITNSVYWVRFQLQAPRRAREAWMLDTKRDDWKSVQLFHLTRSKIWQGQKAGTEIVNFTNYNDRHVTLPLPTPLGAEQTIYVRLGAGQAMDLDLRLWPLNDQGLDIDWEIYLMGFSTGLLVIMVIYNLFLFVLIRDSSYFYYSIYILMLTVYLMLKDGVGIHLLWRDAIWVLEHQDTFTMGLNGIFNTLFAKSFLQTKKYTPKMDRYLSFLVVLDIVVTIITLFVPYESLLPSYLFTSKALLALPIFPTVVIIGWKKGFEPAKYYFYAKIPFFVGGLIYALFILKLFNGYFEIGYLSLRIGVLLESVLFSLALAGRFKYERKLKLEAQQQAIDNLQKADQIKDEFLANTSHELRTPLNGIIGLAEATLEGMKNGPVQRFRSNLSLIVSSGRRLSLLVNDILDLSKLKHNEILLNPQPIILHRVIESVIALSQTSISGKPVQLVNQVGKEGIPLVLADEARLEQILYNLVSNAIKFTHEGTVTIATQQINQHILISVTDTGIGILKSKQTRIFNAFEQVNGTETRLYEGTGLGLSIVKQLVELHKSKLTVESEEHKGSMFSFTLPIATDKDIEPESKSTLQQILQTTQIILPPEHVSLKNGIALKGFLDILIVDDDPLNIEVISQQLNSKHYTLRVAHNGAQALQLVEQRKPDLILLDVMMPEISGFEVCGLLRNQYHQNHLPIIFLTAKNREADVIRGLEIGGNDYLTKPFFRTELIQRVETHLEIALHQKQSDTLKEFANNISQYTSHEEMIQNAFEQITHWSFVDEAGLFQSDQLLFYKSLEKATNKKTLKAPTKNLLQKINLSPKAPQIIIVNSVDQNHPVGQFYQPGHFLFISPQHLPDHLILLYRNLERKPFDDSKAASYAQSMINQIQITQSNLGSLFRDDKLVSVIGKVQPHLFEITHIKSASPTLELHYDSDKRPEYINGCSLDKLSLYFGETPLIRAHKSYLVNMSKVISLQKMSKSRLLKMELSSGEIIPVGRTYMDKIRQTFEGLAR
ncbi:MAG: response regulator [Deltaproteobacteria bacterium]|nr:response regulator [Deltaproteobacteria bacterium]